MNDLSMMDGEGGLGKLVAALLPKCFFSKENIAQTAIAEAAQRQAPGSSSPHHCPAQAQRRRWSRPRAARVGRKSRHGSCMGRQRWHRRCEQARWCLRG